MQIDLAALARESAVYALAFKEQAAFIRSRARKKSLLCPRRAGKSEAGAIYLVLEAIRYPGARCLYIGLTRDTAKRIMWDKLKEVLRRAGIDATPNEQELTLRLANGSAIRLMGLDAHEGMAAKVLGDHYRLIVLDEAASFRIDVKALIKTYLDPATSDDNGTIAMTGTPDPDEARGFFYEVTTGMEPGWERHRWSTLDNPYMADKHRDRLAEIHELDPLYEDTDEYRCMYLGEWPREQGGRVYAFDRARNLVDEAPELAHHVLGLDLGWDDDTALVEGGWADGDPTLYLTHAEKCPEMSLEEIAQRVRARTQGKRDVRIVVDGANKQAVMELRSRYALPLIAAEKTEKAHNVRLVNDDMRRGRVLVVRGTCGPLITEWTGCDEDGRQVPGATALVWDSRALNGKVPRKVEDPRCANHAADSALYLIRASRAWREVVTVAKPPEGSNGAVKLAMAEARKRKWKAIQAERSWANGD